MSRCAQFKIVGETMSFIVIRDIDPRSRRLTVTNDAEGVVQRLRPILKGRRLFYFDSEGELSELKVRDGRFSGFAPPHT